MKNRPPLPDSLTLSEAAQAMTEQTGTEWTERQILGRAVHHEIQINARIGHSLRLVRSEPIEGQKNEVLAPAGCLPPLSSKAVRALLNAGEAEFDGWEHPKKINFFGELAAAWAMEWELAPGEVPPVVRFENCRVSAAGVQQLAENYQPQADRSQGGMVTVPQHPDLTSIGLVAKDAALREHAPGVGEPALMEDIWSSMRETTERDFLKRLSEYLKLGKLRAVNPYNGAPFDPDLPYLDADDPMWSLTHAERERALELLGQLVHLPGGKTTVLQSAGANAAAAEEVRMRQARGFFTLREVAQLLADTQGLNAAKLLAHLISSYHENDLTVRDPDTEAPLLRGQTMRDFFCWVTPEDVNKLLETVWRVSYRFAVVPAPEAAPVVNEPADERRARRLALFEAEKKREKRGALQRVADAEKVDRSNLSKELGKAREERDEKSRGSTWTTHLVRTGKRTP